MGRGAGQGRGAALRRCGARGGRGRPRGGQSSIDGRRRCIFGGYPEVFGHWRRRVRRYGRRPQAAGTEIRALSLAAKRASRAGDGRTGRIALAFTLATDHSNGTRDAHAGVPNTAAIRRIAEGAAKASAIAGIVYAFPVETPGADCTNGAHTGRHARAFTTESAVSTFGVGTWVGLARVPEAAFSDWALGMTAGRRSTVAQIARLAVGAFHTITGILTGLGVGIADLTRRAPSGFTGGGVAHL